MSYLTWELTFATYRRMLITGEMSAVEDGSMEEDDFDLDSYQFDFISNVMRTRNWVIV